MNLYSSRDICHSLVDFPAVGGQKHLLSPGSNPPSFRQRENEGRLRKDESALRELLLENLRHKMVAVVDVVLLRLPPSAELYAATLGCHSARRRRDQL